MAPPRRSAWRSILPHPSCRAPHPRAVPQRLHQRPAAGVVSILWPGDIHHHHRHHEQVGPGRPGEWMHPEAPSSRVDSTRGPGAGRRADRQAHAPPRRTASHRDVHRLTIRAALPAAACSLAGCPLSPPPGPHNPTPPRPHHPTPPRPPHAQGGGYFKNFTNWTWTLWGMMHTSGTIMTTRVRGRKTAGASKAACLRLPGTPPPGLVVWGARAWADAHWLAGGCPADARPPVHVR